MLFFDGTNRGLNVSRFASAFDIEVSSNDRLTNYCFIGRRSWECSGDPEDLVVESDAHQTSIGSTRSGKTVGQVIPNVIWLPGSAFVLDPKAEIAWATAPYLRSIGKKVVIVDPFNEINTVYGNKVSEYERISAYNPLSDLVPGSQSYTSELYDLVTGLIPCDDPRNSHWIYGARDLAVGIIDALIYKDRESANLYELVKILHRGVTGVAELAKDILRCTDNQAGLSQTLLQRYADLQLSHENREEKLFISTARNQVNFLNEPAIQHSISNSSFSFRELTDNTRDFVVFVVLPPHLLEAYNGWLRMMISMAINAASANCNSLRNPVNFFLDEFGTVGPLPVVSRAFGLMGGRGLRLWIFIQTISQLKRDYPNDWQNFLGNSSAISALKVGDLETAELISRMMGERVYEYHSRSPYSDRHEEPNVSTFIRPLMTPDEIMHLPSDRGILLTDSWPVIFRKVKCFEDKPFCEVIRQNPLYLK